MHSIRQGLSNLSQPSTTSRDTCRWRVSRSDGFLHEVTNMVVPRVARVEEPSWRRRRPAPAVTTVYFRQRIGRRPSLPARSGSVSSRKALDEHASRSQDRDMGSGLAWRRHVEEWCTAWSDADARSGISGCHLRETPEEAIFSRAGDHGLLHADEAWRHLQTVAPRQVQEECRACRTASRKQQHCRQRCHPSETQLQHRGSRLGGTLLQQLWHNNRVTTQSISLSRVLTKVYNVRHTREYHAQIMEKRLKGGASWWQMYSHFRWISLLWFQLFIAFSR